MMLFVYKANVAWQYAADAADMFFLLFVDVAFDKNLSMTSDVTNSITQMIRCI